MTTAMRISTRDWIIRSDPAGAHELRAYYLAHAYFDDVVPYTTSHVTSAFTGSQQQRIAGKTAHAAGPAVIAATRTPHAMRELANIVGLDLVLGNVDRHGNNWLISDDGHLYAIDHACAQYTPITLTAALRPVYRANLINDPAHTPYLLVLIDIVLQRIHKARLQPDPVVSEWFRQLNDWQSRMYRATAAIDA